MRYFSVSKSYEFKDSFNNEWIVEIFPIPGGVRYHDHDDIFATFQCEFRKVYGEGSFSLTVNMVKQIHVYITEHSMMKISKTLPSLLRKKYCLLQAPISIPYSSIS